MNYIDPASAFLIVQIDNRNKAWKKLMISDGEFRDLLPRE
jgi:hypothetical protein